MKHDNNISDCPYTESSSQATNSSYTNHTPKRRKSTGIPWLDEPYSQVKGETALWTAVITQAMMDALQRTTSAEARFCKDEAIRWLTSNSKDFIEVCHYANLNPDYVRCKAKKALVSPVAWRAAPGQGKRYKKRKEKELLLKQRLPESSLNSANSTTMHCSNVIAGPWTQPHQSTGTIYAN